MICLALHKIPETSAIGMLIALVGIQLEIGISTVSLVYLQDN